MNLLLANDGAVLDTLALVGAILGVLLVAAVLLFWVTRVLMGSSKPKERKEKTKNVKAYGTDADETSAGRDDLALARASVGYEKRDDEKAIPYGANQSYDPVKAREEQLGIITSSPAYDKSTQESKNRIYREVEEKAAESKKDGDNAKNFFSELENGDEAAFGASADKGTPTDTTFKSAGFFEDSDSGLDSFKFQDETADKQTAETVNASNAIVTPYTPANESAKAADSENAERFDRIMELLNKNAEENKTEPAVERGLIESITRDQINEMLKAKEEERTQELASMQREMQELKQQLKAAKNKKTENYANLLAEEEYKEDEMLRVSEEIAALKRELEAEKEAVKREKAEMAERVKREEFEREMQIRLDEVAAMKRELSESGKKSPKESAEQKAINEEIAALRKDLENQKQEMAREKVEMAERARREEFEREMRRRLDEVEEMKRDVEREKREITEAGKQSGLTGDNFAVLRSDLEKQFALFQAEIDRQHSETQERIVNERNEKAAEQNVAVNQIFERMQKEIDALKSQIAENNMGVKETEETLDKPVAGDVKKADESKDTVETSELTALIAELIEERKNSRAEAETLKAELEAERADTEKRLQEQFEILKSELEKQKKSDDEAEYNQKILMLKSEYENNEKVLREKYDALKREMEAQTDEAIRQNENAEMQLKNKYDYMKVNLAQTAKELAEKNEELSRELELVKAENQKVIAGTDGAIEEERARLQEQVKAEYEENERLLNEKYLQLRTELQRESKQLADKRGEIEQEMETLKKAQERLNAHQNSINEQNANALEQLESEKADRNQREAELVKMREENEKARTESSKVSETTYSGSDSFSGSGAGTGAQADAVSGNQTLTMVELPDSEEYRAGLEQEYDQKEQVLRAKYELLRSELAKEEEAITIRRNELLIKEQHIAEETARLAAESSQVTNLITEKVYTKEERSRIIADYRSKIEVLRERFRINEKAIRENNKEFVPLRRIKDTLERDLKLLRKREAIVAKQQVLIYGVNNITELNPERIKKLEQDVQQLSGLQQSVANCEDVLLKNKDRYPTLENLSKVLSQQNKQLRSDIEEMEQAIIFFESSANVE